MSKDKRRQLKIPKRMERYIEQLYAIDHETYGTKMDDISDKEIVSILETAINNYYDRVMQGLSKAIDMMESGGR